MKKGIELYNELTLEEQEKFKEELLRKALVSSYDNLNNFIYFNIDVYSNEGTIYWYNVINNKI